MMTSTAIPLGMPKVVHYGEGNIFENEPFPEYAKRELKNDQLRNNLRFVTHAIRNKRARVTSELPDWQDLRTTGEMVKNYVLYNLPQMLERAAETLSQEVERKTLTMTTLLEPILILITGGIVLMIVLAVLLPIIEINQLVK